MSSIFTLKTSPSDLVSSNSGISRNQYNQVAPTRDVTGNNFPNGAIHFKWENASQNWWIPSKSYLRMRVSLTRSDGVSFLTTEDDIAPNMDLCAALWQSLEFRVAGKTVSRVADYVPLVDALTKRLSKSKSTLDSINASTNFFDPYFKVRQQAVCVDGISVDAVPGPTEARTREQLGFDAAGNAQAGFNTASLNGATGVVTFAQNGGQALPVDVRTLFPIGSYIRFDAIEGATGADPRVGTPLKVVQLRSATEIRVQRGIIGDIAADGRTDFVRLEQKTQVLGPKQREIRQFEIIWQPPLSIFTSVAHAMPAGKYELVMNPQTASVYQQAAIESLGGVTKVAGTDFKFQVEDMYFYTANIEGPRLDDITYLLDLDSTRAQTEDITSASFGQRNFDVSPSTYALTVAFQDLRSNTDTRFSQTRFRSYNTAGTTEVGLKLSRFFLQYAGQQLPSPDAAPQFATGIDFTVQRYIETQMQSGGYYDSGGAESIEDWHERGAYYYFAIARDGMDRSTRVQVNTGFQTGTDVSQTRLVLFDHARAVCKVEIRDGRVIDVNLEDA